LAVVGIIPVSAKPKQVRVANGDILISDKIVPQMEWWVQGHSFCTDMRVLELQAYDAILGFDWLITHSPINHHWEHKTIEFVYQGESITLHGIQQNALQLEGVPVEGMVKWLVGNDIWALAIVDVHLHHTEEQHSHPTVEKLLQEFQDVFAAPSSLPPQRQYDHTIPILSSIVPVNSRPYRYSHLNKDEIERQVKELLPASLIVPSNSPYASPVLLVQKKMVHGNFV
jgi:hypothetical protein